MKIVGLINLILGVVLALYNGFNNDSSDHIADVEELEIMNDKTNRSGMSAKIGVAVMIIGGIIFIAGEKKR